MTSLCPASRTMRMTRTTIENSFEMRNSIVFICIESPMFITEVPDCIGIHPTVKHGISDTVRSYPELS
jgi:hypothetical protein